MKDDYKVQTIEAAIYAMQRDKWCLTRLRCDRGNPINIGIDALEILKAYYEGKKITIE